MKTELVIKTWILDEINVRASKYNWAIDSVHMSELNPNKHGYAVTGYIVGYTEKAIKVSLDYVKYSDSITTPHNGFIAWIPNSAVLERNDFEEDDEITAADLRTYCSCGIE